LPRCKQQSALSPPGKPAHAGFASPAFESLRPHTALPSGRRPHQPWFDTFAIQSHPLRAASIRRSTASMRPVRDAGSAPFLPLLSVLIGVRARTSAFADLACRRCCHASRQRRERLRFYAFAFAPFAFASSREQNLRDLHVVVIRAPVRACADPHAPHFTSWLRPSSDRARAPHSPFTSHPHREFGIGARGPSPGTWVRPCKALVNHR